MKMPKQLANKLVKLARIAGVQRNCHVSHDTVYDLALGDECSIGDAMLRGDPIGYIAYTSHRGKEEYFIATPDSLGCYNFVNGGGNWFLPSESRKQVHSALTEAEKELDFLKELDYKMRVDLQNHRYDYKQNLKVQSHEN